MQQIDMSTVMLKIGDAILSNQAVKDFCTTNYAKDLSIQVGDVLDDEVPTEDDAPYAIIYEGKKNEGGPVCEYSVKIFIGVKSNSRDRFTTTAGSVMHEGYNDASLFMNTIQTALNDYRKMASANTELLGSASPDGTYWGCYIECSWEIDQALGFNQEF